MTKPDPNPCKDRIYQGDILRDVEYFESMQEQAGILRIQKILFPLAIVLTQDCDLKWDFAFRTGSQETKDKTLISVLLAPMYNAQHFFRGQHLSEIYITSRSFGSKDKSGVTHNGHPRYHYVDLPTEVGVVACVIDFKHYFSSPVVYLEERKKAAFVCKVAALYREDISQRFAAFLSRVGLPSEQQSRDDAAQIT